MLNTDQSQKPIFRDVELWHHMDRLSKLVNQIDPSLKLTGDSFEEHREAFSRFHKYPEAIQQLITSDFLLYQQIVLDAFKENKNTSDDRTLLWAAIKKLGVIPGSDLFENLQSDDIIEIYRNDGIQVFRNFRFHNICSYQYPELFILRWDELFSRSGTINQLIQEAAIKIFSTHTKGNLDLQHIPVHYMKEVASPQMFTMKMQQRFLHPLKDKSGAINYAVAVSKVQVIESQQKAESSIATKKVKVSQQ